MLYSFVQYLMILWHKIEFRFLLMRFLNQILELCCSGPCQMRSKLQSFLHNHVRCLQWVLTGRSCVNEGGILFFFWKRWITGKGSIRLQTNDARKGPLALGFTLQFAFFLSFLLDVKGKVRALWLGHAGKDRFVVAVKKANKPSS